VTFGHSGAYSERQSDQMSTDKKVWLDWYGTEYLVTFDTTGLERVKP